MTRQILLKQVEKLKENEKAYYTNNHSMTIDNCFKFIKEKGKYDFFIEPGANYLALYLTLYNEKGYFFANHLWGMYDNWGKILDICYNIIKYEFED